MLVKERVVAFAKKTKKEYWFERVLNLDGNRIPSIRTPNNCTKTTKKERGGRLEHFTASSQANLTHPST